MEKKIYVLFISLFFLAIFNSCAQEKKNEKKLIREKKTAVTGGSFEGDLVPNANTAIKIAEAIWLPIYGENIYNKKPFVAKLNKNDVWVVVGTVHSLKGGAPYIEIQKHDGKILRVYHEK